MGKESLVARRPLWELRREMRAPVKPQLPGDDRKGRDDKDLGRRIDRTPDQ